MNFTGLYFGGQEIEQQIEIISDYGINKAATSRGNALRFKYCTLVDSYLS